MNCCSIFWIQFNGSLVREEKKTQHVKSCSATFGLKYIKKSRLVILLLIKPDECCIEFQSDTVFIQCTTESGHLQKTKDTSRFLSTSV